MMLHFYIRCSNIFRRWDKMNLKDFLIQKEVKNGSKTRELKRINIKKSDNIPLGNVYILTEENYSKLDSEIKKIEENSKDNEYDNERIRSLNKQIEKLQNEKKNLESKIKLYDEMNQERKTDKNNEISRLIELNKQNQNDIIDRLDKQMKELKETNKKLEDDNNNLQQVFEKYKHNVVYLLGNLRSLSLIDRIRNKPRSLVDDSNLIMLNETTEYVLSEKKDN